MTAVACFHRIGGGCLLGVLFLTTFADAQSAPPAPTRVRAVSPRLERAVARGRVESPTFRAMLEFIEAAPAFVYVIEVPDLPRRVRGCVPLEDGGSAPVPYFRVLIRAGLPDAELTPLIGHELQHVLEMLQARDDPTRPASDEWRVGPYQFETRHAVETELRILKELQSQSTLALLK